MRTSIIVASLAIVMSAGTVSARPTETGFLNRSVLVDVAQYRYQVYVPRQFERSDAWPIILALHGGGEYGVDGQSQTEVGLARAIRRRADRFPAIVVFPQSPLAGPPGSRAWAAALRWPRWNDPSPSSTVTGRACISRACPWAEMAREYLVYHRAGSNSPPSWWSADW